MVEGSDLWNALNWEARNASFTGYGLLPEHGSIHSIVEDWLYSNGYPLVTVNRDYENNTITFRQTFDNLVTTYYTCKERKKNRMKKMLVDTVFSIVLCSYCL